MKKTYILRAQSAFIVVAVFTAMFAGVFTPLSVSAETVTAGVSGTVVSVDTGANTFSGQVRLMYGVAGSSGKAGLILVPGRVVTISVANAALTNFRGQTITLGQVSSGTYFNATVVVDTVTGSVTGQRVQFGGSVPTTTPPPTGTTSTGGTTSTQSTTTPPTSTSTTPTTQIVGFAGKVKAVNVSANQITATVRVGYGRMSGRAGAIIIPGRDVTFNVPAGTVIKRFGAIVPLQAVQAGDLFNATAQIENSVVTAKTIQIFSANLQSVTFIGDISALNPGAAPQTLTITNRSSGEVRVFLTDEQTKYTTRETPITYEDLKVGDTVVVSFYANGSEYIATNVRVVPPETVARLTNPANVERICIRTTMVFGASLNRFEKIIAKMETEIEAQKAAGKNTAQAESDLAEAKADLAEARTLVETARDRCSLIAEAEDIDEAMQEAREAVKAAHEKIKEVVEGLKKTYRELQASAI